MKITTENLNCPRCNILWLMYAGNTIIPKNHGGRMILNCDNADIELFSKNLKEKSKKSVVRVSVRIRILMVVHVDLYIPMY